MAEISFRTRRVVSIAITLLALALAGGITWILDARLAHASYFSGSMVMATIVMLCLLGVRRRLPVLPLGSVSTWTQVHLYTGIFSAGAFLLHVPSVIGGGVLECGLSIVFLLVTASGCYGIFASRSLPKRLTAVEGQHRFDRVGWHRGQIRDKARELLDELSEQTAVGVLGNFYTSYLSPFFDSRPSLAYVLMPSGVRRRRLLSGLKELNRYLESEGRTTAGRFAALVRRRDDLDYQFALQLRLRMWLVVHSVFSVALLVGGLVHAVLVWRFSG